MDLLSEGADAWILCFSKSQDSVIEDSSYDSSWSLKPKNLQSFLQTINQNLYEEIIGGNYISNDTVGPLRGPGFGHPSTDGLRRITFFDIQEVKYSNRDILFECESEEGIKTVHSNIDESAYIKSLSFKHEEEIRVIIRPGYSVDSHSPRYLLPNYLQPVFIPADPILDLIN